jgi:hypothetical protein
MRANMRKEFDRFLEFLDRMEDKNPLVIEFLLFIVSIALIGMLVTVLVIIAAALAHSLGPILGITIFLMSPLALLLGLYLVDRFTYRS